MVVVETIDGAGLCGSSAAGTERRRWLRLRCGEREREETADGERREKCENIREAAARICANRTMRYGIEVHRKNANVDNLRCEQSGNLRQERDSGYDLASASLGNAHGAASATRVSHPGISCVFQVGRSKSRAESGNDNDDGEEVDLKLPPTAQWKSPLSLPPPVLAVLKMSSLQPPRSPCGWRWR